MIEANMHKIERIIRIIVGLFCISLVFWGPKNVFFALGIIPLVTGLVGTCPAYTILDLNFSKKTKRRLRRNHSDDAKLSGKDL